MLPIVVTSAGRALLASAVGGGGTLSFTRICTCSDALCADELEEITELNIRQSAEISGVSVDGNLCEVWAVLDNGGLSEGYRISALGLYAESGAGEILFGVCAENSDAFYMPACLDSARTEVTLRIALSAECSENAALSPSSGAYASAVQLRAEVQRLDERIDGLNFNDAISRKIAAHDRSAEAHSALLDRISIIETILQSDITDNGFAVTFPNMNGIAADGIWNLSKKRLEF